MGTQRQISIIIPNYNGSATIGRCLEAAFASQYKNFEVIVVDDCSTDDSVEIIQRFPCTLIRLDRHSGASRTRNAGARSSKGGILFFIDADCLLQKDTLASVNKAFPGDGRVIMGGTYTAIPADDGFFSAFQSVFIHHSETKRKEPDYVASHAMVIDPAVFRKAGGFPEEFLPILEDVEFSHRLRRLGCTLAMNPDIQVRHIFNFTFLKSLKNAFRKSRYWTVYSLRNRDFFADSGTASAELKINVASFFLSAVSAFLFLHVTSAASLAPVPLLMGMNAIFSRRLLKAFFLAKGLRFGLAAALYYMLIYPLAVGAGALRGMLSYAWMQAFGKTPALANERKGV